MPKTVQLRRYEIIPAEFEAFVAWFQERLIPVREAAGFTIEFAIPNPEVNEFVWAVSVEGDADEFSRVEQAYIGSDGRKAAFDGVPDRATAQHISIVTPLR